jgi:7-carboxy-7-deazaguanine synthase
LDEIVGRISTHPARHAVLTGGEPMIANGIHELATEIKKLGYHITIETAATVAPEGIPCDLASLSPKLRNSAPDDRLPASWREKHERLRWQPEVVRAWLKRYPYQLKFVVASAADVDEIEGLLCELGEPVPRSKVLLMPEGISPEVLHSRTVWLAELCKQRGYRFAPRLHIALYGNRRGT